MKRPALVRVVYKSGFVQDVECAAFSVKFNHRAELTEVKWSEAKPRPIFVGLDDIAAVYELRGTP